MSSGHWNFSPIMNPNLVKIGLCLHISKMLLVRSLNLTTNPVYWGAQTLDTACSLQSHCRKCLTSFRRYICLWGLMTGTLLRSTWDKQYSYSPWSLCTPKIQFSTSVLLLEAHHTSLNLPAKVFMDKHITHNFFLNDKREFTPEQTYLVANI